MTNAFKRILNDYTFRIVFTYISVSVSYIYLSDYLLRALVHDIALLSEIQTFKGLGFVGITSVMLYYLVNRHLRSLSRHHQSVLERERQYRVMLENNNDAIIWLDAHAKITFCSNNVLTVTGYGPNEIDKANFFTLVHPDDISALQQCIDNTLRNKEQLFTVEFRLKSPDGKINWIECNMINHLADGTVQGVIVNARNINQRKADESQIKASEEKYAQLFNSSPLPVWIYDVTTLQFIDVNEAATIQYGYSREEFLKMTLPDIRPKEDLPQLLDAVNYAKQQHHNDNQTIFRHIKKNGELILVRIESVNINLADKNCRMVLAIDMTSFLQQQKELIESNNKLKIAQETAGLGYWKQDTKTNQIYWSDEMYKIFDKDKATFTPTLSAIMACVHPDDLYIFTDVYERTRRADSVYDMEYRIITSDHKERWHMCRIKLTMEGDTVAARDGVTVDLTKRKKDEAAIIKKTILLNSLNKITTSLLSTENWVVVFDKFIEAVTLPLKADTLLFFMQQQEEASAQPVISLQHQWTTTRSGSSDYTALAPAIAGGNAGVLQTLRQAASYEASLSTLPEGPFRHALEAAVVKSVYLSPVFVNGRFHGFFCFVDSAIERIWDNDEQLFIASLISDIAIKIEKNVAAKEMRATREQFESVIANLPGITTRRKAWGEWPLVFVNDEIERLTGYKATDFLNDSVRTFQSIIHPEDRVKKMQLIRNLKPDEVFSLEFRVICKDGRIIWMRGNGRSIAGPDGKVAYVDEVFIDITETHKKELELLASNERFRAVMRAAGEAIIDWDIVHDTVVWGEGFTEFFGYTPAVNDNTLWSRNIHPDDREWVTALMDSSVKDPARDSFYAEFRFLRANRTVAYVQNRCNFIRDEHGKAIRAIGAMADVTESAERSRKIARQNESLRDIAWMQSHVIRAPLATLMGLVALLKEKNKVDMPEEDLLEYLQQSANSLDQVIRDIVKKTEAVNYK